MADGIRATPMQYPTLGLLSEKLKKAQQFAANPFGYSNPPVEMLMNLLGVPAVQQTMERIAYGEPLTTGRGMTTQVRPEAVEAAMTLLPAAATAGKAAERGAMAAGRAGERYAEKVVPQIMERGGMPASLLGDLAQGSQSNITAWHAGPNLFNKFDVTRAPETGSAYTQGAYAAAARREAEGKYLPRAPKWEEKLMGLYKNAEKKGDYESMEVLESALLYKNPKQLREDFIQSGDYSPEFAKKAEKTIQKIESVPRDSYLYKLDIADEALPNYMLFDKPLSQQPKAVQEYAKELGLAGDEYFGGDIVGKLRAAGVPELQIQETLRKRGIPGLIYDSPDVQGSINYVTYDPDLIKILEINDMPASGLLGK
jgi:hypothetical protein